MTDTETMLRAVAQGDRQAFNRLYRAEYRGVVAHAAGLLAGDMAAAEDVADVAFIAIWQGAGSWSGGGSGGGSARGWIRRIVRNKAVDWLRINGRYDLGLEAGDLTDLADPGHDPEAAASEADTALIVAQALTHLSLEQREAVMLCYYEDLPLAMIAAITGCPEGTVKTRLFHARKVLRRMLPDADELFSALH